LYNSLSQLMVVSRFFIQKFKKFRVFTKFQKLFSRNGIHELKLEL
jgi:hypothetical protein